MNFSCVNHLPLIFLGAGGHAKVLLSLALAAGHTVVGVCDPHLSANGTLTWQGMPVLGGDEMLETLNPKIYGLVNGIGQMPKQNIRRRLYENCCAKGFTFPALIHPFAWVADAYGLSDGVQVMAGVVIQPSCIIGPNSIINTRASIDHDCCIGSNVHIAPGATLCGAITVANEVFIGAGATLIHGISVGAGAIIGAGVTCLRNVLPGEVITSTENRRN
jgi:UDP-perosamine 4-acetyltransferase